jgi:hypothetical protein
VGDEHLGLFSASSEHEWIATLQTNDAVVVLSERDEQIVDALLGVRETGYLAYVVTHRGQVRQREHVLADESIVDDDVGSREQA